ncbi:YfhO family protein [bacterium]|nr:YfhO family protein [bacterium]
MGKSFLGYVFLPADMIYKFLPWSEIDTPKREIQWNPLLWDSIAQFYPWRTFLGESLRNGILPLWNPYQFCGYPFYANGQSALFYPFNWLSPLLGKMFMGFQAFIHLFLAGFLLYIFLLKLRLSSASAVFASLTYMLSGFITSWLHLPTVSNTFVWAPLCLLGVEFALEGKIVKAFFLSIFSILLTSLGGHPQFLLYTLFLFVIYLILRILMEKRVSLASIFLPLIAIGTGLILSSVQLLPLFEFSRLAHRGGNIGSQSYNAFISLSMPIERLIGLFLPNFFGNPAKGNYWGGGEYIEYSLYFGLLPLLFLPFSFRGERKYAIPFLAISLLFLLLILGTPLNIPLYFLVPGWSQTGSPSRLISVFTLCSVISAGIGFDALLKNPPPFRKLLPIATTIVLLPFFLFALSYREEPFATLRAVVPQFPLIDFLKLFLIPLVFIFITRYKRRLLPHFAILFLLLDLFPIARSHLYFSPNKMVLPRPAYMRELEGNIYRILAVTPRWSLYRYPPACLPPNTATLYHMLDVGGYDSLYPLYYKSFLDNLEGENTAPLENGNMLLPKSLKQQNLQLLGVKFVFSPIYIDTPYLRLRRDGETKVYEFTGKPLRFALMDDSFKPQGEVRLLNYGPNEVELEVSGNKNGYLILTDTIYPGWRAFIDGKEEKITPFYVFRSVYVPKGKHLVSFRFRPISFKIGLYLSTFTLFLLTFTFCNIILYGYITRKGGKRK